MKVFRRILIWSAAFLTVGLGIVLVNQILQLSIAAGRVNPVLGEAVMWGTSFVLLLCFGVPLILYVRLPSPLVPPKTDSGPEFDRHLRILAKRLGKNPLVVGEPNANQEDIERALSELDEQAVDLIKSTGSRAFITTAISQNGALDSLFVFGLQAKLIWDVSHVYFQRPTIRDMTYLYSNVVGTAFVAGELDDADVSEIVQPVISSVLASGAGAIPGLQVASNLFVNSVVSGTTNAFLTLRVGLIAQQYSRSLVRPQRSLLRRSVIARASGMLGAIAVQGASRVSKMILKGTGKMASDAVSGVGDRIKRSGGSMRDRLRFRGEGEPGDAEST